MSLTAETAAGILDRWSIVFARFRPDLDIAGSPDRTLVRAVVEDNRSRLFRLEQIGFLNVERKNEIGRIQTLLGKALSEVLPPLSLPDGTFVSEVGGAFWQATPFLEGVALDRPAYAGQGWRGPVLADFLVRLKAAEGLVSRPGRVSDFSAARFIGDLERKIDHRDPALMDRLRPAVRHLTERLFPHEETLPAGFAHGDFHPLNIVWSPTGVRTVVDWEFCGWKPEMYDAALLVGCLGMEHPKFLNGDFVLGLLDRLQKSAPYGRESLGLFFDLVLALRFAWLSDWFRRADAEMIELETVYIGLLLDNRDPLLRSWRLFS